MLFQQTDHSLNIFQRLVAGRTGVLHMLFQAFLSSLNQMVKWMAIGLIGVIVLSSGGIAADAAEGPDVLVAVAASSRFAAQAEYKDAESLIPADRFAEMRERRRQWQSEASEQAVQEAESKAAAEQSAAAQLNLDEVVESDTVRSDSGGSLSLGATD
jgi:hypothetical protein